MTNDKKLSKAFFWNIVEILIKRIFDFGVKLVLARFLFPEQFGLVGMAMVVTSFLIVLSEVGISSALIQKKENELTTAHLNTTFWTNIVWSLVLFINIYFVVTPLVVLFYEEPLLEKIIPVLSLPILISSVNVIHSAQLVRDLNFKKLAIINNAGTIIAGIGAIILAVTGFGIWALVFNSVVPFIIKVPLFFYATKWYPKLEWKRDAFNDIFLFGLFTLGTLLVNNLSNNIDYLIIGKLISAEALGVYTLAFMLTSLVRGQLAAMLNRVMYPFYCKIQDDIGSVKVYYLKMIKYYALFIYPIMVAFIILGESIVLFFFGDQWSDVTVPLQILSFAVIIDVFTSSYYLLYRSIGKPKLEFKIQLSISFFIYIPLVVLGVLYNGIIGASYGILIARIISFFVILFLLKKDFSLTFGAFYKSLKMVLIISLITGVLTFILIKYVKLHILLYLFIFGLFYVGQVFYCFRSELRSIKSRF